MFLPVALAATMLAAVGGSARQSPVVAAHDAWERCALEAALAAIPTTAADDAIVRQAREACAAEGLAFVELWMDQRFVRFPAGIVTREQKIANGLERHWRGHEIAIRSMLPEARRTGATQLRMRFRY